MQAANIERSRNRRGEGSLLREEILAAAHRVVERCVDEDSVSLRAIAREASIAAPSIYSHFTNKQEILGELLKRDHADLAARLRVAVNEARRTDNAVEPALEAARAFSTFAHDEPGRYRLMFEFRQDPIGMLDLPTHPVQGVVDALTDAVIGTPAARSGDFTPRELALALLSALHGQVSLWRTLPIPPELATYPRNRDRIVRALVGNP